MMSRHEILRPKIHKIGVLNLTINAIVQTSARGEDQSQCYTDPPCVVALMLGHSVAQNRDEDQIVDVLIPGASERARLISSYAAARAFSG